jgi:hypothetical protein
LGIPFARHVFQFFVSLSFVKSLQLLNVSMEKEDEDRSCISPYSCNLTSKRLRVGDEGAGGGLAPVFFFFSNFGF